MRRANIDTGVHIFVNVEELSQAVADLVVKCAQAAVQASGRFAWALSGGETPTRTYELLSHSNRMPWTQTHVFWADERCVSPFDPRSNFGMANELMLKRVPIPEQNVHRIECEEGAKASAEKYERSLQIFFDGEMVGFDLVLLGLGSDGHTASLFPGAVPQSAAERWVIGSTSPGDNLPRVSLTATIINQSKEVVFLVSGAAKAQIAKDVLRINEDTPKLPAQTIRPKSGVLVWMLDQDAASLLDLTV